jgi:GNAT superfamily N-acetyltransferase
MTDVRSIVHPKRVWFDLKNAVPGVRLARPEDEGQIFALLLMLHAENGMFGLNRKKVIDGIRWGTQGKGGIIYVIDDDIGVVATLGMVITCDWYSDDEYLLERWNYVHPDYRRTDYGRRLIEMAKWTHEMFKADGFPLPLQVGINSFDRTEAKIRLYARHMACIGAYFMYGMPPLQADKMAAEMRRIEEQNSKNRGRPSPENLEVRPVVEAIIRESQRAQRERADV